MFIGYVKQSLGYGRQDETAFSLWRLQDGLFVGHAAMAFTEMSEEAVVRWRGEDRRPSRIHRYIRLTDNSPQPRYVCYHKWITGMLYERAD